MVPRTSRLRIMTWNACAISFPLQIHPLKFLLGLLLGRWWHDACYDAPMEINSGSAQLRHARQADYIRHAGADLAFQNLLQNFFETQTLQRNADLGSINTGWLLEGLNPTDPTGSKDLVHKLKWYLRSDMHCPEQQGWDCCKIPGNKRNMTHTKTKHHKSLAGPHNGFISDHFGIYGIISRNYTYHTPSLRGWVSSEVLLQEVLSTSMLDSLMLHLSEEFECTYLRCHPRIPSMVLWTCFLLSMGALQSLFLQILVRGWMQPGDFLWTWLLMALCFSMSLAIRWRHSIPAHFLFGNIAGQLVVLRRKTLGGRSWCSCCGHWDPPNPFSRSFFTRNPSESQWIPWFSPGMFPSFQFLPAPRNCEAMAGLQAESFDHFGDMQRSPHSEVQARDRPTLGG